MPPSSSFWASVRDAPQQFILLGECEGRPQQFLLLGGCEGCPQQFLLLGGGFLPRWCCLCMFSEVILHERTSTSGCTAPCSSDV